MREKQEIPIFIRLIIVGALVLIGMLTIIGSGPNKVWVKPGASEQDFNKDKYECMKENQKPVSSGYRDRYSASGSSDVVVDWDLFNHCMVARGWLLKGQ
jgi:hypothetical protein